MLARIFSTTNAVDPVKLAILPTDFEQTLSKLPKDKFLSWKGYRIYISSIGNVLSIDKGKAMAGIEINLRNKSILSNEVLRKTPNDEDQVSSRIQKDLPNIISNIVRVLEEQKINMGDIFWSQRELHIPVTFSTDLEQYFAKLPKDKCLKLGDYRIQISGQGILSVEKGEGKEGMIVDLNSTNMATCNDALKQLKPLDQERFLINTLKDLVLILVDRMLDKTFVIGPVSDTDQRGPHVVLSIFSDLQECLKKLPKKTNFQGYTILMQADGKTLSMNQGENSPGIRVNLSTCIATGNVAANKLPLQEQNENLVNTLRALKQFALSMLPFVMAPLDKNDKGYNVKLYLSAELQQFVAMTKSTALQRNGYSIKATAGNYLSVNHGENTPGVRINLDTNIAHCNIALSKCDEDTQKKILVDTLCALRQIIVEEVQAQSDKANSCVIL